MVMAISYIKKDIWNVYEEAAEINGNDIKIK